MATLSSLKLFFADKICFTEGDKSSKVSAEKKVRKKKGNLNLVMNSNSLKNIFLSQISTIAWVSPVLGMENALTE